jgi:probable F420-dependent oxidoreductase
MKLDVNLRDYDLQTVAEQARQAEANGYDCLWTSETQHDPFLPLAVAANAAAKIKLGTSIAVAFARSPMTIAYTAWDLQKASQGRFILGLGSQVKAHIERRFSTKFESPGPKLREMVQALHAIWDCWQNQTPLRFDGRFYHFSLMTPFFNPGPIPHPRIPTYIAGVNAYMCRTAGEVCDGLHVHPFHTTKYLRDFVRPAVNEGLKASGRSGDEFTYATACFVVTGETEQERSVNEEAVRQNIAFYASTRTYEPVLAAHGWESLSPELHRKSLEGDWKTMTRLIPDELLNEVAVSGTYEGIGKKLREKYAGLLDRIALYQPYGSATDHLRVAALVRELSKS